MSEFDWLFESVLQFMRSPMWKAPVLGFIEEHCHEFAADEPENKLIYTSLHNKFREIVDDLLTTFLQELGVSGEAFIDAVKNSPNNDVGNMVTEYITALDDFPSFRALMEKHNVEMELEAMYEYAKYMGGGLDDSRDADDDERFLLEMAIRASLGDAEIALKRLEREDAELLQALAISVALEQERVLLEALKEENLALQEELQRQNEEYKRRVTEEVRQHREQKIEAAVAEISSKPPGPPALKELAPVGSAKPALASIFQKAALPSIGSGSAIPVAQPAPQPSFEELKQKAITKVNPDASGPTAEEIASREAYLKAQRDALRARKATQRESELQQYAAQKGEYVPPSEAHPSHDDEATREMRRALARRFKEDLIEETRKVAREHQ